MAEGRKSFRRPAESFPAKRRENKQKRKSAENQPQNPKGERGECGEI